MNLTERFWAKVDKRGPDDCWEWTANRTTSGYGRIKVSSYKTEGAHRLSYYFANGEDPGDMLVCHTCDNPACVNPAHLFIGTAKDNAHDKMRKGRDRNGDNAGAANPNAKINEADAAQIIRAIQSGQTNTAIAERFAISHSMVSRIRAGKSWIGVAQRLGYQPRQSRLAPKSGRTKAQPNKSLARTSKRRTW